MHAIYSKDKTLAVWGTTFEKYGSWLAAGFFSLKMVGDVRHEGHKKVKVTGHATARPGGRKLHVPERAREGMSVSGCTTNFVYAICDNR